MSQESSASTVPYELSQSTDQTFVDDLNAVNDLYFNSNYTFIENESVNNPHDIDVLSYSSDNDSVNYESDVDDVVQDFGDLSQRVDIIDIKRDVDIKEDDKISKFKLETCNCKEFYKGTPCSTMIDFDDVVQFRQYCQELDRGELDLVIKAELFAHRSSGPNTSSNKHKIQERSRPSQQYFFKGFRICRATFCFAHDIAKQKLHAIAQSLDKDGLKPRVHGLSGKLPSNSLTFEDKESVLNFLKQYASDNALPLPGRLPNFKNYQVLLLPSDKSQSEIHQTYLKAAAESGLKAISLSTFSRLWKMLCSNIVLSKPNTDLCQECQKLSYKISNSGNMEEDDKLILIDTYTKHVEKARAERQFYREECLVCKEFCQQNNVVEGV
jgi:hypothetical protein